MSLLDFGFMGNNNDKKESINNETLINKKSSIKEDINDDNAVYVYTDGSCFNNGKSNAKAGIGVYIPAMEIEISEKIDGKQSNNTAELKALKKAFECIEPYLNDNYFIIYSDSDYALKCIQSYGRKLEAAGWSLKGKKIPNLQLVKTIYYLFKGQKNIFLRHILAHTNKKDIHSIGNDKADELARKSLGHYGPSKNKTLQKNKIFLNVPYSQKDTAKSYGAMWDKQKKSWYIFEDSQHKDYLISTF